MSIPTWDVNPQQETNIQEPSLQYKLGEERLDLAVKIEKLKSFMTTNPAFQELEYRHRALLEDQLGYMLRYEQILVDRMVLLNQPK